MNVLATAPKFFHVATVAIMAKLIILLRSSVFNIAINTTLDAF